MIYCTNEDFPIAIASIFLFVKHLCKCKYSNIIKNIQIYISIQIPIFASKYLKHNFTSFSLSPIPIWLPKMAINEAVFAIRREEREVGEKKMIEKE